MAQAVAEDLAEEYVNEKIDEVEIVTTAFKNMMSYSVQSWQILPVLKPKDISNMIKEIEQDEEVSTEDESLALMEFEPNIDTILQTVAPMYVSNLIYQAFLEATASELASRMMAMSAASENAQEMIARLTLDYNKARQYAITQELTELIGGANALKG